MWNFVKAFLLRLRRGVVPEHFSDKPSQALRQLNSRYMRQKRLWVYIVLSSLGLVIVFVLFSIFWSDLWINAMVIPAAWIILAGIGIAVFQIRRCNDVIHTLRQTYVVQVQIEKAQAEKEAEDAEAQKQAEVLPQIRKISESKSNGSLRASDSRDRNEE